MANHISASPSQRHGNRSPNSPVRTGNHRLLPIQPKRIRAHTEGHFLLDISYRISYSLIWINLRQRQATAAFLLPDALFVQCASQKPIASCTILVQLSTFRINTCKSVSKQTTLTPFRMNTYQK
jgi:hypothetical protein